MEVDDQTGPRTLVGAGEECLLCSEDMGPGEVYVFLRLGSTAGIAHQDCVQEASQQQAFNPDGRAAPPPRLQ